MADTPSPPSPEILEKLRQLREELAQKAAQQAPKDANTLAWQQSNAFKRVYPRANGGQIKATQSDPEIDALFREPSLTMDERFRKYVAPVVREGLNSGLNGMLPMRKLASTAFEKGVYRPIANFVNKNANDLDDADVQGKVEEYKRIKDMELRNKIGLRQLPVEYDLSKFNRRLVPNSFPNPDNPIEVPKSLERDWTELLSQPKAKGGVIDMDRMRLELMGKAKGGSAMGVNVASDRKHNLNYADLIVDGHKTIESRNSDTLRPYVGKRVAIVRTGAGKAKAIGEVTIGEPIVANKKQFRNMESHHLVPEGSTFDIKTPTKHMYPLSEPVRYDEERDVGHGIISRKVIHEAKGGSVKEPKNTVKAYKLFRVHPKHPGKLFPLFVNANEPVEMNKWVDAKEGEMAGDKVKSKIGPLAYRPGWHAGDLPVATHIGEKSDPNLTAPDVRPANHVWAEVEMPHDVDWQSVANERGMNPKGKLIARNAHITDQIPKGGHYRYKTNSNMTGNWLIGGSMKVNRVLHDKEVKAINKAAGAADLPRTRPFKAKDYGFASGGVVAPEEFMAEEHVNYKTKGGSVIKKLEAHIKDREGQYGLQRLQRAADEIPHLGRMYSEEALRSAFSGDNAKALMTMNPSDFEKYAEKLRNTIGDEDITNESRDYGNNLPYMTRDQYIRYLAKLKGGFSSVPFLEVEKRKPEYLPSIEGHEGRHRSRSMSKKGINKSLVQLLPTAKMREPMPRRYREDFIEAMKKELGEKRLVTPEGRSLLPADLTAQEHRNLENRNLLAANRPQLPEVYKSGGATHAHHLDIEERPL